jgi:hypothetical protein
MSGTFGQLPFADRPARSDRDHGAEHAMNAPFSQHCKNRPDNPQNHLPQTRRDQDEAASDNRICRLCFCTRTNLVGIGYARSNTLYVGQSRWGNHSGQRRPRARTRAWVGPSRRSRPPLWLAASPPLVVNKQKQRGCIGWQPLEMLLALFGRGEMSGLSPLCAAKRT